MDPVLEKVIGDLIIEKYISKYIGNKSSYIKQEAYSHILLCILQSNYKSANNLLNYIIGIIVKLLNSKNSSFYSIYLKNKYICDEKLTNKNYDEPEEPI